MLSPIPMSTRLTRVLDPHWLISDGLLDQFDCTRVSRIVLDFQVQTDHLHGRVWTEEGDLPAGIVLSTTYSKFNITPSMVVFTFLHPLMSTIAPKGTCVITGFFGSQAVDRMTNKIKAGRK